MFELLLLEDETNVGSTLCERLEQEGFVVSWAKSFQQALMCLEQKHFNLAILDVGLPDGSGFDVANILRQNQQACAVIFLTAFGGPEDRVRGLELGAEDYMVKPFHFKELLLRIRNALKRSQYLQNERTGSAGEGVQFGQATVNFSKFQIERQGQLSPLSHKECAILKLLYDKRGHVVSRDEILDFAWSKEEFPTPRTVDNFIMRLRRLVEQDPEDPRLITSVRGVGYQLDA